MKKFTPIEISRENHNKSNYYVFYSMKNRRNIHVYTQLAYYNCLRLEMNATIELYCEYPCELILGTDNKHYSVIIDFWVKYKKGENEMQRLVDNKLITQNDKNALKLYDNYIKEETWCKENNYCYRILSNIDIYQDRFYVHNLRFLYGLVQRINSPIYEQYLNQLIKNLKSYKSLTIKDLIKEDFILAYDLYKTIALGIYNGSLKITKVSELISHDTEVQVNS